MGIIDEGRLLMVEDKKALLRRWGEKRLLVTFTAPVTELPEPMREAGATLSADGRTFTYPEREGCTPGGDIAARPLRAGPPGGGRGDTPLAPGGHPHRHPARQARRHQRRLNPSAPPPPTTTP